MDDEEYKMLRRVYKVKEGIFPPYGQAATIEQSSAFRTIVSKLNQIYAGFQFQAEGHARKLVLRGGLRPTIVSGMV